MGFGTCSFCDLVEYYKVESRVSQSLFLRQLQDNCLLGDANKGLYKALGTRFTDVLCDQHHLRSKNCFKSVDIYHPLYTLS